MTNRLSIYFLRIVFIALIFSFVFVKNVGAVPVNSSEYSNLKKTADVYCNKGDLVNGAVYYAKAFNVNNNEQDLNKLGLIFYLQGDYENAKMFFKSALKLNPNNLKTEKKLEFINEQIEMKKFGEKINSVNPKEHAPEKLHNLVQVSGALKNRKDINKLHRIIDFIWSDKEGKILLNTVIQLHMNIYLKDKISNSHFGCSQTMPMYGYENYDDKTKRMMAYSPAIEKYIYIREADIAGFQEKGSSVQNDMISVMVVVHELCHMIKFVNYFPQTENSREEELICYILGMNMASRILTGSPLSEEEVREYAYRIYNSIFKRYYQDVRNTYDFASKMARLGFELPHYSAYYDIKALKLKPMASHDVLKKYTVQLNNTLSTNYDSIYTNKYVNDFSEFFISKAGKVYVSKRGHSSGYVFAEQLFNLGVAVKMVPYPEDYNDILVPVKIYRSRRKTNTYFL